MEGVGFYFSRVIRVPIKYRKEYIITTEKERRMRFIDFDDYLMFKFRYNSQQTKKNNLKNVL